MIHAATHKSSSNSGITKNKNWYSEEEIANMKIEAWKKGIQYSKERIIKQFHTSEAKAKRISEEIFIDLYSTLSVKTEEIKVKATAINSFKAIFIIPQKDYFSSDRFDLINKIATDNCRQYNDHTFNFSFLFMPYSKKINEEAFISDGFHLTFGNRK